MIIEFAKTTQVKDPKDIVPILQNILKAEDEIDQMKEHFWSIGLDARRRIDYIELVTLGILDQSLIHPRETFRLAIMKAIDKIVIAHNHPAGNTQPSEQDIEITHRLEKAGKILGIQLLDHVIITLQCSDYFSWRKEGLLK